MRTGEAGRQWNGPDQTRFSVTSLNHAPLATIINKDININSFISIRSNY